MNANQIVMERLQELPESMTLEEMVDELDILVSIHRGLDDVEAGRVTPHEDVVQMVNSWTFGLP